MKKALNYLTWPFRVGPLAADYRRSAMLLFLLAGGLESAPAQLLISMQCRQSAKYCIGEVNNVVYASKNGVGSSCVFYQIDAGGGYVAFKTAWNDRYLRVRSGDFAIMNDDTTLSDDNRFQMIASTGGSWALRAKLNNRYVTANNAGGNYLSASKTSVSGNWERFHTTRVLDIWLAMIAFPNNFPGKCKRPENDTSPYSSWLVTDEAIINGRHGWFQRNKDTTFNPQGEVIWDNNGLIMIGDWEVWSCFGTYPYGYGGATWVGGIPRTARYFNPNIHQDSPVVNVGWYFHAGQGNCSVTGQTSGTEWGRRYPSYMLNLSNPSSQENMGVRWVVDVGYKDFNEKWTFDLGPSYGVFSPRYGLVKYVNQYGEDKFNNIQNDYLYSPPHCGF